MVRWLVALSLLMGGAAQASDIEWVDPPTHRLVMENLTALRYNPLGLQEYFTVSYRLRLFDSDSSLLRDNYVQIGPQVVLSPAFAKVGVQARIVPAAFFDVTASYRYQYFFGNFDHVVGFDSTSDDWSDSALEVLGEGDGSVPMGGHLVTVQPGVTLGYGPIGVRSTFRFEYFAMPLEAGDVGYYDQTPDMLVPGNGWLFTNDTNLMYLWGKSQKLKTGVRYTATIPFYGNGEGPEGNQSHRVGPMITYMLWDKPGSAFNKPTFILMSQWHVVHRFRTGEDVSAAIPYLALAFSFEGDLIPWAKTAK